MFRAGQHIGNCILVRRLGRGGFGEVWLAERRGKFVTTNVAVKLPIDEDVDYEAIKQESVLWARASGHPNVLPIIDADEYDGQVVIVSEYAQDGSLDDLLRKENGPLNIKRAVDLTIGILSGLEFLHSKGIVHRDLKPANVLLQGEVPRLTDFGISRVIQTTSGHSMNHPGSPSYMSPEAFEGQYRPQLDIWSVGIILYQMLTGNLPFHRDSLGELLYAIIHNEPAPIPDSFPSGLQAIVTKSLAKEPIERYQSAREMREDLSTFLSSQVAATQRAVVAEPTEYQRTLKTYEINREPDSSRLEQSTNLQQTNRGRRMALYFIIAIATVLTIIAVRFMVIIGRKTTTPSYTSNSQTTTTLSGSTRSAVVSKLIPFRKGDKWGFSDVDKKLVIDAKYEGAGLFAQGLGRVKLSNDKWGLIDESGRTIVDAKYDTISLFVDGLALVGICNGDCGPFSHKDNWGFIDKKGNEIVEVKYDDASHLSEGLARVTSHDGKITILDSTGKAVFNLPNEYYNGCTFSDGLLKVHYCVKSKYGDFCDDMKVAFVDKTGRMVIGPRYYDPKVDWCEGEFSDGLAAVATVTNRSGDKLCGFVDKSGKLVIPFKYPFVSSFSERLAAVEIVEGKRNGVYTSKWGFIDRDGNTVIAPQFDYARAFSGGLAIVRLGQTWGYVDKAGQRVGEIKYEWATPFSEGLAGVKLNGKWGFIDKNGREKIPFRYDSAYAFKEGLAFVQIGNLSYYIDEKGTEYYEP